MAGLHPFLLPAWGSWENSILGDHCLKYSGSQGEGLCLFRISSIWKGVHLICIYNIWKLKHTDSRCTSSVPCGTLAFYSFSGSVLFHPSRGLTHRALGSFQKIFLVGIRNLSSSGQLQACGTWTSCNRAKLSLDLPDCAWCFLYSTTPKSSSFWPENISLFKGQKDQEVQSGFSLGSSGQNLKKARGRGRDGMSRYERKIRLSPKVLP